MTQTPDDLRVEFFRHALGDEEKRRVLAALDETILTTGAAVAEAERALEQYLDIPHVVCLDSCTAALHLALIAEDIGPDDEVIVPASTFVATANAVIMAGATPVFADVDPRTGCLTPRTVAPHMSRRTRAIIPVHLYGLLCDMPALSEVVRGRQIALIEDAAHCLEARRGDVRPGSHSRSACFSFYATKALTCGEGGALATHDATLAERVRRLALHGITSNAVERYRKRYQHWDMPEMGWKYNLDNIRGSLLLPQIRKLDVHCARRREICAHYEEAFRGITHIELLEVDEMGASARHLFPILVDPDRRDTIMEALHERGIGTVVNYRAVHLLSYYARRFGHRRGDFPAAEALGDRVISLPLFPTMTDTQVERVIDTVLAIFGPATRCTTAARTRPDHLHPATAAPVEPAGQPLTLEHVT